MFNRSRLIALAAMAGAGILAVPAVAAAMDPATPADPTSLVEDYAYPDAAKHEPDGIKLIKGDGHITLAKSCTGSPDQVKVESVSRDFCFDVTGKTGWLSLRLEAVFLVGAGDQNVAVKVEGMPEPIDVPAGAAKPIMAKDPARRGVVVELRTSDT